MRSCFEPVGSSDFFKCVLKQSSVNTFFSILAFSSFMEQGASITADKMCGQDCFLQKQNVYLLSFVITLVTLDSHKPVTESGTYRKSASTRVFLQVLLQGCWELLSDLQLWWVAMWREGDCKEVMEGKEILPWLHQWQHEHMQL